MFYEHANFYADALNNFYPCPPITEREAWNDLRDSLKNQLIKNGEIYLNAAYPALTATAYMDFNRTGNRTRYEKLYRLRRLMLNNLVLAECVENKGRFLDDIINGIIAICEESAWQYPAHNAYSRHAPTHPLPDITAPILDIFACETGALLAMVHFLLKDVLNAISPVILTRIEHELNERIFTPYLNTHFWWMNNGSGSIRHWSGWCIQNILLTTFVTHQTDYLKTRVFKKSTEILDYFLNEYGDDGCCDEGPQYYRRTVLCLFNSIHILNSVTKGHFSELYTQPKIRNMADYINYVHVDGPYYINFSDCSAKAGSAGVREFLFGKATHNTNLMAFAAKDYQLSTNHLLSEEPNLFLRVQSLFTDQEILNFDVRNILPKGELYYPSVGLFITRDSTFCLAAKAGNNHDSQNHNDTGSFILYKNGQPMFIDVGVESYTQKTFSPQRYDIWYMQSDYHNLPTLNGIMQYDGKDFMATEVETDFSSEESFIEMELSTAYPEHGRVSSYKRRITLQKEKQVLINDRFEFPDEKADILLNFITYELPIVKDQVIEIGTLGTLTFEGDVSHIEIEVLPITDTLLKQCWAHDLYRIRLQLNSTEVTIKIQ